MPEPARRRPAAEGGKAKRTEKPPRRAVPEPARRLPRWLVACGRIAAAVVWLAALWNAAVPTLRCSAVWADKGLFLLAMVLPWLWLRPASRWNDVRWRIGSCAAIVACGLGGPWLAWRTGAWAVERKQVSAVNLPAGGRVVAWEERDPGSKHYRMLARHERQWLPGVLVVRVLARFPDSHGGLVEMVDDDTVRIRPARVLGEVPVFVRDLLPWVWWQGDR